MDKDDPAVRARLARIWAGHEDDPAEPVGGFAREVGRGHPESGRFDGFGGGDSGLDRSYHPDGGGAGHFAGGTGRSADAFGHSAGGAERAAEGFARSAGGFGHAVGPRVGGFGDGGAVDPLGAAWAGSGSGGGGGSAAGRALAALNPGRRAVVALGVVGLVVALVVAFAVYRAQPRAVPVAPLVTSPMPGPGAVAATTAAPVATGSGSPESIVVAVTGRVRHPGLVRLPVGARVADAIAAAGGVLPGTDLSFVNLAAKVVDGQLIAIGVTPPPGTTLGPATGPGGGGVDSILTSPYAEPPEGYRAVLAAATAHRTPVAAPRPGEVVAIGPVRLTVLAPVTRLTGTRSDPNNNSLVIRLDEAGARVLLTGDAEVEEQAAVLAAYGPAALHADVLKVPHHGSAYQDPAFLAAVAPRLAFVSVAAVNVYGLPSHVTLDRLTAGGARVMRTDVSGDLAAVVGGGRLAVATRGHPAGG